MKISSLFNVNGSIGKSAYGTTDFPAVSDLLKHMDYLEIDRSFVSHILASELSPSEGNRLLLKEISDTNAATERLLPAFVVTPACYYENGTIKFLRQSLKSGRVKALKINESGSGLSQLKNLFSELAELKPIVLCDLPSMQTIDDIESLATEFPGINFVLTQVRNRSVLCSILNLMSHCQNVYVDISWIYIRSVVELICKHHGAERVLFGVGDKSHYGAAIAELAFAQISDAERELIAHGNIERLLQLPALDKKLAKDCSAKLNKPLWDRLKNGETLDVVKIIDAHVHDRLPKHMGYLSPETSLDEYGQNLVKQAQSLGVDQLVVISGKALLGGDVVEGNRETEKTFAKYGDMFKGYLGFNPRFSDVLVPLLDDFFGRDFYVGFKLLSSYWKIPVTDSSYNPVWEYANKYHLPILLHTWSNDIYNSPVMLTEIVKQYPNAIFSLGHSGGGTPGRFEAIELAQNNDNVYLEFCGSFTTPELFENAIKQVGIEKVIYGSDTSGHSETWELGRFLSLPLNDDDLLPALAQNMESILNSRAK